ncbi:Aste57867_23708 [Aphanomyces stellatus]|uniref:Aste57867_23708 protein n=1 Tax=Aphanomyces stellatus TaxID=120398 RepID=A0A485LND0_9STRA|nr:hypothetical protein As57867_023636 [Aphanomyces stellatus]VFU00353.1 Aste57867_23708 [Aphanomyces stellatus]
MTFNESILETGVGRCVLSRSSFSNSLAPATKKVPALTILTTVAIAKQFDCTVNADLFGDDLYMATDRSLDVCLSDCQKREACNGLTWAASSKGGIGQCYLKNLKDSTRRAVENTSGVRSMVSCKFNSHSNSSRPEISPTA